MRLIAQGRASCRKVTTGNPNCSISSLLIVFRTSCLNQGVETGPVLPPCPRRTRSPDVSPRHSRVDQRISNRRRSSSDMGDVDEAPQTHSTSSVPEDWSYDGLAEHTPSSSKTSTMCNDNGPGDSDDAISSCSQPMVSRKSYHDRSYLCTYGCDLRLCIHSFRCCSTE